MSDGDNPDIGFIGAGALGKGLALALAARGYPVAAVSSRSMSSARDLADRIAAGSHNKYCDALASPQEVADRCRLVFITTPDGVIGQVASQVEWRSHQGVVHCSGSESLDILGPAAGYGAATGSFHPFQTFACLDTPEQAIDRLEGITFSVEGQGWLRDFLEKAAEHLGGRAIFLRPEHRAIYHASAVISCGYLAALLKAAADIWGEMGVPEEEALATIIPIAKSTLLNVAHRGIEASVTGPMMRGDLATLERHLEALGSSLPQLVPLYCSLSQETLPLAQERVDKEGVEAMDSLIRDYASRYISR
jgi:predicted short-subunit dehydrogenase-like oxidoreductase (DUF2520 family)